MVKKRNAIEIPLNSVLVLMTPLSGFTPLFSVTDTVNMYTEIAVFQALCTGLPGGTLIADHSPAIRDAWKNVNVKRQSALG